MSGTPAPDSPPSPAPPLLLAVALLWVLHTIGGEFTDGWALQLGNLEIPTEHHLSFLAFWSVFGTLAALAFAAAAARWARRGGTGALLARLDAVPDRTWVLAVSAIALALPALIRLYIYQATPVSDDEGTYEFMAEIMARGRLYLDSPELKLFYDRDFMINDGKYYSQYFLGWPALMLPGVFVGAAGYMNAIYSALTIPPLYGAARRITSRRWARVVTLLYLAAPMIQLCAATALAHTSCTMALTWLLWLVLRARDEGAPIWVDAGVAAAFSVAFFVRPTSALGIGLPLLLWWALAVRADPGRRLKRALAFAAPAGALGAAFLAVNHLQTGSALTPAYNVEMLYHRSNGFRFSRYRPGHARIVHNMGFSKPLLAIARNGIAWLRLNFALFGWPCSFLFALLASGRGRPGVRAMFASAACFFLVHVFVSDSGIDVFGPTHYFELSLPALILTGAGLQRATRWLTELSEAAGAARPAWSSLPVLPSALLVGLVASALLGYVPVRATALHARGLDQSKPARVLQELDIQEAVVFAPKVFNLTCLSDARVLWNLRRPLSHPDLNPSILWVNHVDTAANRAFMTLHPDRAGYIMAYKTDCDLYFIPIDHPVADAVAPAVQVRPPMEPEW